MPSNQKRQLAAIMFTDVAGYTALMSQDEKKALAALQKVRDVLKPLIEVNHGRWLKEIGDGTLSSFSSALDAVYCALEFQRAIQAEDFKIRIGIHVGDVTYTEDDVFGDGVNIASRLEPLAPPGGVFISDRVFEDIQNKPDISTFYIGERKLKNVPRPIRVYALSGEGLESPSRKGQNSLKERFQDLWDRRVFQIVGLYLVFSYFITQMMEWVSNKFLLSGNWSELLGILMISLIPSVLVVAYFHGKSGPEKWVKAEKVTVPANLVITLALLFFLFQGKELGAQAQTVVVTDEEGQNIEKVIPTSGSIKRIVLFSFKDQTGNPENQWLSLGIPYALEIDLSQDMFINSAPILNFSAQLLQEKIDPMNVPLSWMRQTAREYRFDYFLTGDLLKTKDEFQIEARLYQSSNGKLISTQKFSDPDLFLLIDQLGVKVRTDLGFTTGQLESSQDLPVKTLFTGSLETMREYVAGLKKIDLYNQYPEGIAHLKKAVEIDPSFAYGYFFLAVYHINSSQFDAALEYMDKTMEYLYVFPEWMQFRAKAISYFIRGEHEKRIKILKMWSELYPEDPNPVRHLGHVLFNEGRMEEALEAFQKAVRIDDDRGNNYVMLSRINGFMGNFDEAEKYLGKYLEKFPNKPRSYQLMGYLELRRGNFEKARDYFEKSSLLKESPASKAFLVYIEEVTGNFEVAEKKYHELLADSKNPADSAEILQRLKDFYFKRGQLKKGIDFQKRWLDTRLRTSSPVSVILDQVTELYWHMEAGLDNEVLKILENSKRYFTGNFENLITFGTITYYSYKGDIPAVKEDFLLLKEWNRKFGVAGKIEWFLEGDIYFLEKNYDQAAERYLKYQSTGNQYVPESILVNHLAEALRLDGRETEAQEALVKYLKRFPYDPEANYQMGLIHLSRNDSQKGREYLERAARVWENADPEYQAAQECLQAYSELAI